MLSIMSFKQEKFLQNYDEFSIANLNGLNLGSETTDANMPNMPAKFMGINFFAVIFLYVSTNHKFVCH